MPTGWKPNQRFACFYVIHGVNGVGWGEVGWGNNVHLHFLTYMMLRYCVWLGGVEWGGVITFIGTSSHIWCYATVCRLALPHIYDATLLYVVLHFLTYMMLRYCMSSCTSSHIWCYAAACRLALPHIYDATLVYVVLHFLTYMMLRYCMSSCTSSHTWCYATVCRLALPHIYDATLLYVVLHFLTYMMLRYCMSSCTSSHIWCYATVCRLALPHINDATLLDVVLHFLTYMMLRYWMSSCTSSQIWCYATVCRLALPHIHDATLLYVVLHFLTYMMLRYCMSSCTSSHIWCYATVCRLALPHIYDATLLYVVLHFLTYMMLRCCMSSCTSSHIWCYASVCRLALPHERFVSEPWDEFWTQCTPGILRDAHGDKKSAWNAFAPALGSEDGKTVPTKTCPSSLQTLSRTLSAEKKRLPLRFFTFPVKSTRVLFKEIELSGRCKTTVICGIKPMTNTANVENAGSINNPPGCLWMFLDVYGIYNYSIHMYSRAL